MTRNHRGRPASLTHKRRIPLCPDLAVRERPDAGGVSVQTRQDLAAAERDLVRAERLRAAAAARLAAVRARGDGERAIGMTIEQHLRHITRLRRDAVTDISLLGDVLGDLPALAQRVRVGAVSVDQAAAVAGHAARVGLTLRRALDAELADGDAWTRWTPEHIAAEVGRILALLTPQVAAEREESAADREFLHVQPTLDGQAVLFKGRYEGLNAALFDATIAAASPAPARGEPRGPQRAAGLARILRDWATGHHGDDEADGVPPTTIHLLVDERTAAEGAAAEVWTSIPGLHPTLTAAQVARLAPGARTITTITRDGSPVAVLGRDGHVIEDPDALSWDTLVELTRVRDGNRCRMPGCDRPVDDVHHLIHRARGGKDRLTNLAGLCRRCHHRVLHRHGWSGHADLDGRLHLRRHDRRLTTEARKHRRLRRPPPLADPHGAACEHPIHLDRDGQPLPF